ncbi:MAG: DUF6498-containing protein [Planctomycetota bacterium]
MEAVLYEGLYDRGQTRSAGQRTEIKTAFFFLAHYGFFHLLYAFFLIEELRPTKTVMWRTPAPPGQRLNAQQARCRR